ncbi:hypothetical protein [Parvicella tangerina]|uniref:Lipoprotein n=1 Tax=Parvicella tangerina TaxID=2829795 RepID=A0A916JRC4_9FLAO|nr:hypothetical protein [Parvicella tangerina]CAG5087751.1 hypothetical protein CRYO30217_03570 [Parvicella tangerina]
MKLKVIISIIAVSIFASCKVHRGTTAHNLIAEQDGVRVFSPHKTQISCDSTWLLFSVDYTPPQNIIVETNTGEIKHDDDWESRFVLNIDCDVKQIILDVYRLTESGEKEKVTQLELGTN